MTVLAINQRRKISAKSKEVGKFLQNLSINQPVFAINRNTKRRRIYEINRNEKRRRIYRKDEGETYTQKHLSTMFPHDIMLIILSKLPAKPLVRFRSVSRSWNYLIRKDQFFINMHLSSSKLQHIDHEKIILADIRCNNRLYSLDYSQGSLERLIRHNLRYVRTEKNTIWGTCNGLICTGGSPDDLHIWNPCTTEYTRIPFLNRDVQSSSIYGFGYNSNANDYVLVEIIRLTDFVNCYGVRSAAAIYSLRNKKWKSIGNIPYEVTVRQSGELVNGSLHWAAHSKFISEHFLRYGFASNRLDKKDCVLLAFEIASEKFLEMPWPDCNYELVVRNVVVSQYQGKLCVFNDKSFDFNCDLWVMNDYGVRESWVKAFSFRKYAPYSCPPDLLTAVVCCTKEGSILMKDSIYGSICSYDPKHRTRRHILGIHTWAEVKSSYVPSIVALNFD